MKAKGSSKDQTKKANYMSDQAFAALRKALKEALAFERGMCRDLHVTLIMRPER